MSDETTEPVAPESADGRAAIPEGESAYCGFPGTPALLLLGLLGVVLVRTAWLCDDAYITFRTIDNCANGLGLRWNPGERVQAFTHPLWLGVLLGPCALTREVFLTPIAISVATSLAAAAMIPLRIAASGAAAAFSVSVLLFSRAFVDYSTSGLENPLTNLLLAAFVAVFLGFPAGPQRSLLVGTLASLVALNRLDAVLLVLPAVALELVSDRGSGTRACSCSASCRFSSGSSSASPIRFPISQYSLREAGHGDSVGDLFGKDFITLGTRFRETRLRSGDRLRVLLALLARGKGIMLAGGLVLYLAYVVRIGGDFVSGRFLSAPLFLSMLLVAANPPRGNRAKWALAFVVAISLSLSAPYPPLATGSGFGTPDTMADWLDVHGIGDERRFYYQDTGLLRYRRGVRCRRIDSPRKAGPWDATVGRRHAFTEAWDSWATSPVRQFTSWTTTVSRIRSWPASRRFTPESGGSATSGAPSRSTTKSRPAPHGTGSRIQVSRSTTIAFGSSLADPCSPSAVARDRRAELGSRYLIPKLRYRYPTLRVETLAQLSTPGATLPSGFEADRSGLSADGLLVLLGAVRWDHGLAIEATPGESFEVLFLLDGTDDRPGRRESREASDREASRGSTAAPRIGRRRRASTRSTFSRSGSRIGHSFDASPSPGEGMPLRPGRCDRTGAIP